MSRAARLNGVLCQRSMFERSLVCYMTGSYFYHKNDEGVGASGKIFCSRGSLFSVICIKMIYFVAGSPGRRKES
jgi:hypothetical protein